MAMTLESLKPATADKPPRILIYGEPGIGKTSLAAEFPGAALVRVEDGIPAGVEIPAFPKAESFDEVMEALGVLYTEDHPYTTVIIDSITEFEKLVFAETCARGDENGNAKANVEAFGFGKGYVFAKRVLEEFIDAINTLRTERNMTVILIAHAAVQSFNDPESESYNRWEIALKASDKPNADLRGAIEREMDAIFLIKTPINVEPEKKDKPGSRAIARPSRVRKIYTEGTPALTAKNRYGMPPELRYDLGKGYAAIAPYLPGHGRGAAADDEKEAA